MSMRTISGALVEHGMVQHLKVGVRHPRQLRAGVQHRPHVVERRRARTASISRLDGGAVDERLELRPALEPVGAREHELRVVQRERRRIGAVVVRVDLGDGGGVAADEACEQFLRLTFELIEIGSSRKRASRKRLRRSR